jgi:hypothetical protein
MVGNLNAKHPDWNSRLTNSRRTALLWLCQQKLLRDHWPDSPTTVPYQPIVTPAVLNSVMVKEFVNRCIWLCPTLSSNHLRLLIDNTFRSSFQNVLDHPDFTRMDSAVFQACLECRHPSNTTVNNEEAIDKTFSSWPARSKTPKRYLLPSVGNVPTTTSFTG